VGGEKKSGIEHSSSSTSSDAILYPTRRGPLTPIEPADPPHAWCGPRRLPTSFATNGLSDLIVRRDDQDGIPVTISFPRKAFTESEAHRLCLRLRAATMRSPSQRRRPPCAINFDRRRHAPLTLSLALAFASSRVRIARSRETTIADLQSAMGGRLHDGRARSQAPTSRAIAAYDKAGADELNTSHRDESESARDRGALTTSARREKSAARSTASRSCSRTNYGTFDLPTTAGSQLLEGWVPPADASWKKLRDAGAVIWRKVNLSEFAAGGSVGVTPTIGSPPNRLFFDGGRTRNPPISRAAPLARAGGTGSAIAGRCLRSRPRLEHRRSIAGMLVETAYAGLKRQNGLVSRDGIVPLA